MLIASMIIYALIASLLANCFVWLDRIPWLLWVAVPVFVLVNLLAGMLTIRTKSIRLRICHHGTVLLGAFYISMVVSVVWQILVAVAVGYTKTLLWSVLMCVGVHFILFWNGILCVYLTSTQLGIQKRLIGALCGMIPVANLIALFSIIRTTAEECKLETGIERLNEKRCSQQLCATKYPILLVHGVFFRDTAFFNYWGRIPQQLEANGGQIFYGNQASAASVAESAGQLAERIKQILQKTGAEKVNIIAHSKGGLDCRYAIAKLGVAPYVASLTTINTPHRGCLFADYLLTNVDSQVKERVANAYNGALRRFGEPEADFLAAVNDLTECSCSKLNEELGVPEGIYCQSVGSVLKNGAGGKFPLNFSYHLVRLFSGENDGLVSESSFEWGENYTLLRPVGKRGISHGDMIDLNRENIPDFDVREFYVKLVHDLKKRGL